MSLKKNVKDYVEFLASQPKGVIYKEQKETQNQSTKEENKKEALEKLYFKYKNCQECPLCKLGRTQVTAGQGDPRAKLMFVGEGPGRDEDLAGVPFVGRAGHLLTKIIQAMKLERKDVYISNVVKCRPPGNRTPLPEESEICKKLILFKEIDIIKPQIICTLGACATQALLGNDTKISKARGQLFKLNNYQIIPTFHPAYLLRNPEAKKDVWEDAKKIIQMLEKSQTA
jgi:uracil-DNA glycosylase